MKRIDFYKTYFENVSPTTFKVSKQGNKIIIEDIDKPYPKGFDAKDVKQYPLQKETFMRTNNNRNKEYKKGGKTKTYRNKYNKKYGYGENESHSLKEISKKTGVSKKGLQQIYNKGIGAFKTNPQSVRPNVTSKEQWAMGRVYSAVMGGKASKVDAKELKMKRGGLTPSQDKKVAYVMGEFKRGDLKSSSGKKVTDYKQAIAIALSEAENYENGGQITQTEINSMREYIDNPNSNERLANSYRQTLRKFGVADDISRFPEGQVVNTYDFSGYEHMKRKNEEMGIKFLLWGEYELVSKAIYEKDYSMWLYYNYIMRISISFDACKEWFREASEYFKQEMPIPVLLKHTPRAKDGRSYAMWYTASYEHVKEVTGEIPTFQYDNRYYYQEIGMVGNGDHKGGDWTDYYREQKTGLTVPEYQKQAFSFQTLIHEFAHVLDFQTQLLENIAKKEQREQDIRLGKVKTIELSEQEQKLYGTFKKASDEDVSLPITTHYDEFVDALLVVIRACANGSIPIARTFERQAVNVQNILSGVYGDLILENRIKRQKTKRNLKAQDEDKNKTRFSYQKGMFGKIRNYIIQNALQDSLKQKLSNTSQRPNMSLVEIIEFDNLINSWFEKNMRTIMSDNPSEAKSVMNIVKGMKAETNRIINNHYDNIRNRFQFGYEPQTDLDRFLLINCKNDFKDYKSWKECSKKSLQEKLN